MLKYLWIGLIKLGFILAIVINTSWGMDKNKDGKFISLADIHFDPFVSCSRWKTPCESLNKLRQANPKDWAFVLARYQEKEAGGIYHDTNYKLLNSTLLELKNIKETETPSFVLILGDFLAHNFRKKYKRYSGDKTTEGYQAFLKKTFQYLAYEFSNVFPDIDVYFVVGNNDTYGSDYQLKPNGAFFKETMSIWAPLIKNKKNRAHFEREFPIAGYYHVEVPTSSPSHILILNTVLFSSRNPNQKIKTAAFEELDWLNHQLKQIEKDHQKVLIAYHIPSGVDVFATFKLGFSKIEQFWQVIYNEKFENILLHFPATVTGILAGHIHMDTYQSFTIKKFGTIPSIIIPSISPFLGNSPSFKVITYDRDTFELKNKEVYYLNNEEHWQKR